MKRKILLLLISLLPVILSFAQSANFTDSAAVYFLELQTNTARYRELWNLDIYGPVLLVDPGSRKIFANYPDSAGTLKQEGVIFTGRLSDKFNIANTSIDWNGRSWAMIMLPLPETKLERLDLMSHELFHRSQPSLGFRATNTDNNHLDQRDGRVYLRLELEALRKALEARTNAEMHEHLANAMFFRKTRYSLFPGAVSSENLIELNEGLAEYTGLIMSGRNDEETIGYFEHKLAEFQSWPTFVRSFAYLTTPLYGFILNRSDKSWNRQITDTTNLTSYFINAFSLSVPVRLCPDCLNQYGSEIIIDEEAKREKEKEVRVAEFKRIFIEQPHVEIRLEKMNISFDPRNIVPLEGYGTVYPTMRVSDIWGILTVTDGALLTVKWDKVSLSEPTLITSDRISGKGWTLQLNPGYQVEKNIFDGNYILKKR